MCPVAPKSNLQGVGKPATAAELEFARAAVETRPTLATAAELEFARAAVETRPTLYGYLQLSLWYHQAGEFGECIALAERSLRIDPNSTLAYNNICSAYLELGEFDRAIDSCGKALAIDPSFEYARNNLKWAQVRRK